MGKYGIGLSNFQFQALTRLLVENGLRLDQENAAGQVPGDLLDYNEHRDKLNYWNSFTPFRFIEPCSAYVDPVKSTLALVDHIEAQYDRNLTEADRREFGSNILDLFHDSTAYPGFKEAYSGKLSIGAIEDIHSRVVNYKAMEIQQEVCKLTWQYNLFDYPLGKDLPKDKILLFLDTDMPFKLGFDKVEMPTQGRTILAFDQIDSVVSVNVYKRVYTVDMKREIQDVSEPVIDRLLLSLAGLEKGRLYELVIREYKPRERRRRRPGLRRQPVFATRRAEAWHLKSIPYGI